MSSCLGVVLSVNRLLELTLSGAEREHGWLTLACWTSSHHQHLVKTGGLQLWQPQAFLTARDTNRLPASHHCSHFIKLTHTHTHTHTHGYKYMTKIDKESTTLSSSGQQSSTVQRFSELRNDTCEIFCHNFQLPTKTESCCQHSLYWPCWSFIVRVKWLLKQTQGFKGEMTNLSVSPPLGPSGKRIKTKTKGRIFSSPCDIWQNRRWWGCLHRAPPSIPSRTCQACESAAGWWWSAHLEWGARCSFQPGRYSRRLLRRSGNARGPRRSVSGGAMEKPPAAHRQWCWAVELSVRNMKNPSSFIRFNHSTDSVILLVEAVKSDIHLYDALREDVQNLLYCCQIVNICKDWFLDS